MVPLDMALLSSYRLSIVTMWLTAAVWPQFATQVFRGGIGRLTSGSYVNKQVGLTTFTFRAQATTCSKRHTRTVTDAGCKCAPWVRSANPSDSWALVFIVNSIMYWYYEMQIGGTSEWDDTWDAEKDCWILLIKSVKYVSLYSTYSNKKSGLILMRRATASV